ncbi:MAG TPA: glycine cleavage T C-terminal barrel domain-containing protein [Burkholderiales bacterium]|jgi:glycine cleavage system aminomethyltransferase T|nr:glycine cleavage T C-terminal barrel domain-containing protein [Burkholderiales bacterium]
MQKPFDMRLIQRGARLKRSPYFEATQRAGCWGYTVYNHTFLPIGYADLQREYWNLLEGVTLWDVSVERNVEIAGPDAYRFMSLLTPRDLSKCAPGHGRYVLLTAADGGIVNDPVLLRIEEDRFWLAAADSDVFLWAEGVALNSGMDVDIRELDVAPMQVQGPKSRNVMQDLFGERVLTLAYYEFFETTLGTIPLIVTRTGWTGELGYEIYLLDCARGLELWDRIIGAGERYGIVPTGPSDIRRIEAGILNYGIDMTLAMNPYEVGLERLVNLEKPEPFIGRDALQQLAAEGVQRKVVGVEIDGEPLDLNMTHWPVRDGNVPLGDVTSAVYSPRLAKNIGYAMVPIRYTAFGTRLLVDTCGGERDAVVVPIPFIDPAKALAKG